VCPSTDLPSATHGASVSTSNERSFDRASARRRPGALREGQVIALPEVGVRGDQQGSWRWRPLPRDLARPSEAVQLEARRLRCALNRLGPLRSTGRREVAVRFTARAHRARAADVRDDEGAVRAERSVVDAPRPAARRHGSRVDDEVDLAVLGSLDRGVRTQGLVRSFARFRVCCPDRDPSVAVRPPSSSRADVPAPFGTLRRHWAG